MNKYFSAAAAAMLVMTLFSGCTSKNDDTKTSDTSSVSSVSESESETSSSSESEIGSETSSSSESETGSETTSSSESESSGEASSGETDTGEENPLKEYADAALSVGDWPEMMEVTDENILSEFFLLDKNNENYKSLLVMQCPMSANMSELIIIEAEDTSAASDDLKERRKKAQETDAFYPDDVDKAENAIVGTSGNYAYYILGWEPEKSEEALLMKLEGNS